MFHLKPTPLSLNIIEFSSQKVNSFIIFNFIYLFIFSRANHLNKGKQQQRDRRKLREKRRSTGVVHLPSTEVACKKLITHRKYFIYFLCVLTISCAVYNANSFNKI